MKYNMTVMTSLFLTVLVFCVGSAWADVNLGNLGGTQTTTDRLLIKNGTYTITGTITCGGNWDSLCNYVGVDNSNAATLNIDNNGTLHCSTAKGAGHLAIGINDYNQTATVNVNGGTLKVDRTVRMGTQWSSTIGSTSKGTLNVSGGTAVIGSVYLGSAKNNSGSSTLNLNSGTLETGRILVLPCSGRTLYFKGGTLKAKGENVLQVMGHSAGTRTLEVTASKTSTFNTQGYSQRIPALTGTGVLGFTGGGVLSFDQTTLTYGLKFSGSAAFIVPAGLKVKSLSFDVGAKIRPEVVASTQSVTVLTTTDGVTVPTGTTIADFVEVRNATVTLSADKKSIVATAETGVPASSVPYIAYWTGNGAADQAQDPANWTCKTTLGTTIPNAIPGSGTIVSLTSTASSSPMPSSAVSSLGVKYAFGDLLAPSKVTWYRKGYGYERKNAESAGIQNFEFLPSSFPLTSYTYMGSGDGTLPNNLNGSGGTWQTSNLKQAQVRFDGWVNVPSAKAGTWTFYQKFDDYYAFAIDDVWVAGNISYSWDLTTTANVTAGWHRFTIIAGDTWGGYGSLYDSNKYPMKVKVAGSSSAVPFTTDNFEISNADFPSAKLSGDLDVSGKTTIVRPDTTIDLNGHTLGINSYWTVQHSGDGRRITIKDTTADAEGVLSINVPSGKTYNLVDSVTTVNSTQISVEKKGAGTLTYNASESIKMGALYLREGILSATALNVRTGTANRVNERFAQTGGTLAIGAGGITTGVRNNREPLVDLASGTLRADANFNVRCYTHAVFGAQPKTAAQESNPAYTVNPNGKTITWTHPITGFSDVTVSGTGTFTSDSAYQGAVFGNWTVATTGVNLSGVSSFGGNLTLNANATATVNISGENQVEGVNYGGANSFDNAVAYARNAANGMGYVVSNLKQLHTFASPGDPNNCSWAYRGEFYVPEDKADQTWYFACNYDDRVGLYIDDTVVLTNTGWLAVGTGSRTLSAGWHPFVVTCYDGTGGQGPAETAWNKNEMALGWSLSDGGTNVTKYTKFDTTSLQMRLPQMVSCGANRKTKAGTAYPTGAWNTEDLGKRTSSVVRTLATVHATNSAELTGQLNEFTGLFYVAATQAGTWSFRGQCADRISLAVDGTEVLATTSADQAADGACDLTAGWHAYRIRMAAASDTAASGALLTDGDGKASSLMATVPSGSKYLRFDESNFRFAANVLEAQGVNPNGLCGVTTLNAGSTLTSSGDYCPIRGTLKGSGTLSGKFRFVGEDNCWEIESGAKSNTISKVTFAPEDTNPLSGLKKLRIHFTATPVSKVYELMKLVDYGLTEEGGKPLVDGKPLAYEVTGPAGNRYSPRHVSLRVADGKLYLQYTFGTFIVFQ